MHFYKSDVCLEQALVAVQQLSFWLDGSGAEMAVVPSGGLPSCVRNSPVLVQALAEISAFRGLGVLHIMVNKLKPGVIVPVHRDFLQPTPLQPRLHPTIERWHLPIVTNHRCTWWDEESNITTHLTQGFWQGPVPYWKNHQVLNKGHAERIHLVVDLDTEERLGEYT